MDVLITGAHGRVGTGIIDHLADREEYEFAYLDRRDHPDRETFVADVSNYDDIRPAFDGQDAVVHLAAYPSTDGTWSEVLESNIVGMHNVLEAASDAGVEKFVFASSFHTVGMYEVENAPEIYSTDFDLHIDHTVPQRPDSEYGATKCYGEDLGRYFVETQEFPEKFYAIRIASVRSTEYDHPYGIAEQGVDEGRWERGSDEYERKVERLKATWLSHRDLGQLFDLCLQDESVTFDIFYGVSDNDRRWIDINHAREVLGYDPQDNGETWSSPP